jgi:hypothetical protein
MKHLTKGINWSSARIVILLIAVGSGGCAQIPTIFTGDYISQQPSPLEYYLWVKSLPNSEHSQEIQKLQARQNIDQVIQQIQLSLLLSVPKSASAEDEDHAITTLEHAIELSDKSSSRIERDYQQFALLWSDIIKHRRVQKNLTNDLSNQNHTMEEENKVLLKQIEALKSIEQQINQREKTQDNTP